MLEEAREEKDLDCNEEVKKKYEGNEESNRMKRKEEERH